MDWGTVLARRARREGWHMFSVYANGTDMFSPLTHFYVSNTCADYPGWDCDRDIERLLRAFALAPTPDDRKRIAAEIQAALKPDESYVKLLPLGARTYGVLLTKTSVRPYAVDRGRAEVDAAVRRLREPLEPTESLIPFDAAASAAMFDKLFGPVKAEVLASRHLVYEPEGPLVSLPVALFVTDAGSIRKGADGETDYVRTAWLGKTVSSSLAVSGASFLQSRAFATRRCRAPRRGRSPRSRARSSAAARRWNGCAARRATRCCAWKPYPKRRPRCGRWARAWGLPARWSWGPSSPTTPSAAAAT